MSQLSPQQLPKQPLTQEQAEENRQKTIKIAGWASGIFASLTVIGLFIFFNIGLWSIAVGLVLTIVYATTIVCLSFITKTNDFETNKQEWTTVGLSGIALFVLLLIINEFTFVFANWQLGVGIVAVISYMFGAAISSAGRWENTFKENRGTWIRLTVCLGALIISLLIWYFWGQIYTLISQISNALDSITIAQLCIAVIVSLILNLVVLTVLAVVLTRRSRRSRRFTSGSLSLIPDTVLDSDDVSAIVNRLVNAQMIIRLIQADQTLRQAIFSAMNHNHDHYYASKVELTTALEAERNETIRGQNQLRQDVVDLVNPLEQTLGWEPTTLE